MRLSAIRRRKWPSLSSPSAQPVRARLKPWVAGTILTAALLAGLLAVSDAPFRNPAPATAEFVFTFRALGGRVEGDALAPAGGPDNRPVHMRAMVPAGRSRHPVVVELAVDG